MISNEFMQTYNAELRNAIFHGTISKNQKLRGLLKKVPEKVIYDKITVYVVG